MARRIAVAWLMPGAAPSIIVAPPVPPAAMALLTAAGPHRLSPSQNAPMSASARMNHPSPTDMAIVVERVSTAIVAEAPVTELASPSARVRRRCAAPPRG